ncbi:pentatricopeptide repeat-containing protein At4g38010-like [Typha angustifolia]|uniref:pentatricopeptide repeat-containing protein At4g38010-like n=1 Tax=Typha angustifolia TaxID=59011 RepID=UPI003C2B9FDB
MFDEMPHRDVVSWTGVISAHARSGFSEIASDLFCGMLVTESCVTPNEFTCSTVLRCCTTAAGYGLILEAKFTHKFGGVGSGRILSLGCSAGFLLERCHLMDLYSKCSVGNTLVDLYSKCSPDVKDSAYAFQAIDSPNVVSWTALIAGLAQHGRDLEAFIALTEMRASGVQPNSFTLSTVLKGCSSLGALTHARKIHAYVMKTKSDSLDAAVGNSLVDVYARFTRMEDAWTVASTMILHRDVVTYTSMAKGLN